jgi:hypothetical protein
MPKNSYETSVKQEFNELVDSLELKDRQKYYLKSRWLDQVLWMEGRATRARNLYYRLRLISIIGGVLVPAMLSLNLGASENQNFKQTIFWSTFFVSTSVALSSAIEQFFNYGERWRHYRRSVETLKTQGWQFFELSGDYDNFKTHDQAFYEFSGHVEAILQRDVEVYSTQVVQTKKQPGEQQANAAQAADIPSAPEIGLSRQPVHAEGDGTSLS